jgi:hypothetical protein
VFVTLVDPVKATVWVPAASTIVRVPVQGPLPSGVKVTLIVQFPLAATLEPQVLLLMEKSPLIVMLETASGVVPALLRVTDWAVLVEPTATPEKVRLLVERDALEPVPLKLTVCGLPLALSETDRVPLTVPPAVGVKITLIVQVPPAAKVVPQVLEGVWKGLPVVIVKLVKVSAAVPEFVTVTD